MTPRPHAWTRRAALVTLFAGASLLTLPGLRPPDPALLPPAVRADRPRAGAELEGQEGRGAGPRQRQRRHRFRRPQARPVPRARHQAPQERQADHHRRPRQGRPVGRGPSLLDRPLRGRQGLRGRHRHLPRRDSSSRPKTPATSELMEGKSEIHIQVWEIAHPEGLQGQREEEPAQGVEQGLRGAGRHHLPRPRARSPATPGSRRRRSGSSSSSSSPPSCPGTSSTMPRATTSRT